MHRPRLAFSILIACLASATTVAQPASPQAGSLPRETLNASRPTPQQQEQVRQFVQQRIQAMQGDDPEASKAAREQIADPLVREISVGFRLLYSQTLMPELRRLAEGSDDRLAFNALEIAGALATEQSAELIRDAFPSEAPTRRYAAAFATRLLLDAAMQGRSPVDSRVVQPLVESLADALRDERNPVVAEGMINAVGSVTGDIRARAEPMRMLSEAAADLAIRVRTGEGESDPAAWARALARAVGASQRLLLEQAGANIRDEAFARAAARLGGQALALGVQTRESGSAAAERSSADLLRAAEVSLLLATGQLSGRPAEGAQPISEAIERGDDGALRSAVDAWIGAQGRLTRPPFSMQASSFASR